MKRMYTGGTILTMDKAAPRAEAILTESGRICKVGSKDALLLCGVHMVLGRYPHSKPGRKGDAYQSCPNSAGSGVVGELSSRLSCYKPGHAPQHLVCCKPVTRQGVHLA